MPAIPTTNNGSVFYNQNDCRSFRQAIGVSLTQLSAYPCSEVIIVNKTAGNITIYDNGFSDPAYGFLLGANESFTFRGITNTSVVSAIALSAGNIYYRTQYFSLLPQR